MQVLINVNYDILCLVIFGYKLSILISMRNPESILFKYQLENTVRENIHIFPRKKGKIFKRIVIYIHVVGRSHNSLHVVVNLCHN